MRRSLIARLDEPRMASSALASLYLSAIKSTRDPDDHIVVWSRDMTPSIRGCWARLARKPLTAAVKSPVSTQMSARCFARLRCSSRPFT